MTICYINGSFENKSSAMISIQDRGFNFSDGVYEVMSFVESNIINYKKHINRLENSLKSLKIKNPMTNIKSFEIILKRLIKINKLKNGYLYLQITRGSASRNHLFPANILPNLVIFTFTNKPNDQYLKYGVNVILSEDKRWNRCDIKSISLLPNVLEKQEAYENKVYEVWQRKGKYITEGSTSNAFIINKKNQIQTHPANNFILGGVTRDSVIEVAKKLNFIVKEKPFTLLDLKSCKEAFLTSTTVKILPVVRIDNLRINNEKPGRITRLLINEYNNYIKKQLLNGHN